MRLPGTTSPVTVRVQGCCFSQGARQFQSWPVTRTLTIPARSAAPFATAAGAGDGATTSGCRGALEQAAASRASAASATRAPLEPVIAGDRILSQDLGVGGLG